MARPTGIKTVAVNKKARQEYEFMEEYEAGLALTGAEVKSVRASKVNFKDSYVDLRSGEAWLKGLHIAPYENAGYAHQDPDRDRKLLLHGWEIEKLKAKSEQKGLSVIPSKVYFKNGRAKVEIVLAKGKKLHDKREDIKRKDMQRETSRLLSNYR